MRCIAGDFGTGALIHLVSRLAVAGVVLATICFFGGQGLLHEPETLPILQRLGSLILVSGLAGVGYLVTCHLLRVGEVREAVAIVKSKLK